MKRFVLLLALVFVTLLASAGKLVLIETGKAGQSIKLLQSNSMKIHFYKDEFVIASIDKEIQENYILLDTQGWQTGNEYFVVYCPAIEQENYLSGLNNSVRVLFANEQILVLKTNQTEVLQPYKNDGIVRLTDKIVSLPANLQTNRNRVIDPDPEVQAMMEQVTGENLTTSVQHLQDYGTRNCYTPQSIEAQNWIAEQFTNLGLSVEIMDFPMSGSASDNVIATLPGTVYPNEYVVVGSHYDSYAGGNTAPGADDNASGSAAVLEIARILSQYTFDRTIIFCTFSGEEYGLYGSEAFASRCAEENMDIHGYFNLDMIGYLQSGGTIHTDVIYPSSAQELYDFYFTVCAAYLPDFLIEPGSLSGGDSDHTSFNNNGFMGIFPFEDSQNYSPYIHTANDIVGPSYNNEDQAVVFTKASLVSVVTMANRLTPPQDLVALPGDSEVELNWDTMPTAQSFNIYRDNVLIDNTEAITFIDSNVENGTQYTYYITAIYADSGEESDASNLVVATPMPPISLPLFIDFENGAPYWEIDQNWGLSTVASYSPTHSLTESPTGDYDDDETSQALLRPFSLNQGYTSANLSFYTKFNLESGYDYMYLEITTNGSDWTLLATYNGNQSSWQQKSYSLNNYLGADYVQLRFRFESDSYVTEEGMYIDDFRIDVEGGFQVQTLTLPEGWSSISSFINPVSGDLEDIFASLEGSLLDVQTMTDSYLPLDGINTIGEWNAGEGYKIKLAEQASLQLMGSASGLNSVEVQQGWNLIPVLSACDVSVNEFLTLNPSVQVIKEIAGTSVAFDDENLATLETLIAGKAYTINSTDATTISFPDCSTQNKSTENREEVQFTLTANSHLILLPATATDFCSVGDQIIVLNSSGLCAGSLTFSNTGIDQAIVVFGEDTLTSATDGMLPGEFMKLIWIDQQLNYHMLTNTYNQSYPDENLYVNEGISKIESMTPDILSLGEKTTTFQMFPNPATDRVQLFSPYTSESILSLLSADGKLVYQSLIHQKADIDVSGFTPGLYKVQLSLGNETSSQILIVK